MIEVKGGRKAQRNLAEDVGYWCWDKMMPRKRNMHIDVTMMKPDGLASGYCTGFIHAGFTDIEIELSKALDDMYSLTLVMCHEMVHAKQIARKEFRQIYHRELWHGEDHTNTRYRKQPWEIEAYSMDKVLAKEFIREYYGITLKKARETRI